MPTPSNPQVQCEQSIDSKSQKGWKRVPNAIFWHRDSSSDLEVWAAVIKSGPVNSQAEGWSSGACL
ncbi:rCG37593 [Rattus norvegicus]|uniref:RCG37593 n=1 Tax=Rattus norvegicus TaxID=10116 RepID=A6K7W7_RAT|nr:rCG37593 [Rattus norvegicus]